MRFSVRRDDPGFAPEFGKFDVFLEGTPIRGVVTADEEEGYILAHWRHPETGQKVINRTRDGAVTVEYRGGRVEIRERVSA